MYATLVLTQHASIFLERAISQSEAELWRAEEIKKNYAAQGELVVSLTNAKEKADQKIQLLEAANQGLINQGVELESSLSRARERVDQQAEGLRGCRPP